MQGEAAFQFSQAWAAALPAVAGYVGAVVGDRHATDDLVQEAALAAFRAYASYAPERPFTAWALGIAKHKVHDHWRRLAQGRQVPADPALIDALADCAVEMDEELSEQRAAMKYCLGRVGGRAWDLIKGR